MLKLSNIFLLLFIVFFYTVNAQIKKTTTITLLDKGLVKVECTFKGKINSKTRFGSDMIRSFSDLKNISVTLNGEKLSQNLYSAGVHKSSSHGFFGYISFLKDLNTTGDLNIHMSFETKVYEMGADNVIINLGEEILKSEKPMSIDYKLILKSSIKNFFPEEHNYQKYFGIEEKDGSIIFKKHYDSFSLYSKYDFLLVQGLEFISTNFSPSSETSKNIKLINTNLIEESFNYSLRGSKSGHMALTLALPEIKNLTNKPEINLNIDGIELSAYKMTDEEFERFNFGDSISSLKFLYYFGISPHEKYNNITLAFNINKNQIGNLKIRLNYDPENSLVSADGFNYLWKCGTFFIIPSKKNISNYFTYEIPNEFVMNKTSIDSNIIRRDNTSITYNIFTKSLHKNSLIIHFSRIETKIYNVFKIINKSILFISIIVILLIIFKVISYNFVNLKYKIILAIFSFFYAFIFGNLSTSNFLSAIEYTWSWVPLTLVIFFLAYSFVREGKK